MVTIKGPRDEVNSILRTLWCKPFEWCKMVNETDNLDLEDVFHKPGYDSVYPGFDIQVEITEEE